MRPALLVLSAVAAPVLACLAILHSGGWGRLIWIPVAVMAGLFHTVLHFRAVVMARTLSPPLVKAALIASALFLLGFMLQIDEGDGPAWIIGPAVFGARPRLPHWWPFWANFFAFAPLVIAWVVLIRKTNRG